MPDYYLEDPQRLPAQPKRMIADYVEQNGILVPRRFDLLQEAVASHKEILLRSEHPQDYTGVSGMLDSFELEKIWTANGFIFTALGKKSVEQIKEAYFDYQEKINNLPSFKEYCRYTKTDEEAFKAEVSFSLWEKIPGFNRTVVADSAIKDRYHIMTVKGHFRNYVAIEQGKIVLQYANPLSDKAIEDTISLLETYETIRNLERFDPQHCPIMEFQTHHGKHYFLQYHRTRDFAPTTFCLERERQGGEIEVPFVRGATAPEGMISKTTLYYENMPSGNLDAEGEDGSYDLGNWHVMWQELQVRRRKVQMMNTNNIDYMLEGAIINHDRKSKLFKPEVSIIHDIRELLKDYRSYKKGKNSSVYLHITSDGRRALVKLIPPPKA